jgi:ribonuclease VapC
MTGQVVLDASAILAFLQGEPGEDVVRLALHDSSCLVSAANQAEVIAKALDRGATVEAIQSVLADLAYTVVDITAEDGAQAGWMRDISRKMGLSLGDRLCLAVAQRLKAQVLTADRPWLSVAPLLGLDIQCIRPDAH